MPALRWSGGEVDLDDFEELGVGDFAFGEVSAGAYPFGLLDAPVVVGVVSGDDAGLLGVGFGRGRGGDGVEMAPAQGPDDANVELVVPADASVLRVRLEGDAALAHPTQVILDLHRLGGADRHKAAERVREWLLAR